MINVTDPSMQHVLQGQLLLADAPNQVLTSILGSCVAACVRDPILRLGGMNHFLLPGYDPRDGGNVRYGARSMEELVNALLRRGAQRSRLEVSLYGGADLLSAKTGIGKANGAFAMEFVRTEGFILRDSKLGGTRGRRVKFHPHSGETQVSLMQTTPVEQPITRKPLASDIELF